MKKLKFILPLLLVFTLLLTACNLTPGTDGENNGEDEPQIETVSIADAKAACQTEGVGVDEFYVRATVASVERNGLILVALRLNRLAYARGNQRPVELL